MVLSPCAEHCVQTIHVSQVTASIELPRRRVQRRGAIFGNRGARVGLQPMQRCSSRSERFFRECRCIDYDPNLSSVGILSEDDCKALGLAALTYGAV